LRKAAAAQQRRRRYEGSQHLANRLIEIGQKLIDASAFIAHGKRPTSTGTPLDIIDDALRRTADAARCWEVNPSIDNDRRLTRLVEQAQDAIARAYLPTETTLRLLHDIAPDGVRLALIQCEDSGSPLIAISIDADHTLRWRQAAGLDTRPAAVAGRLSGYARKIVPFAVS